MTTRLTPEQLVEKVRRAMQDYVVRPDRTPGQYDYGLSVVAELGLHPADYWDAAKVVRDWVNGVSER